MSFEKRQYERFDIILVVVFRAFKKSLDYFHGITRNFSHEGLSFEYHNCDLQSGEILDIKLKHPNRDISISALGEIVWEKRSAFNCEVGIKFWVMNREARKKLSELNPMYSEMPLESFYYDKDFETGAKEGVTASTINSDGVDGLNLSTPQKLELQFDKGQATSSIPEEIKGLRRINRLLSSLVKFIIVTVLAVVIITFEDINIRIPEEEMKDAKEMKRKTIEVLYATDIFEKALERDEELVPAEGNKNIDKSDKFVGTRITDAPQASQKTYDIQRRSFFNIGRFVIARSIANREPIGIANSFSHSTEKVYCFLEARDIAEDKAINLAWYHNYKKITTVELPIKKGGRWRTYSSKRLMGLRGIWKVELQDVNGTVLENVSFIVE